MLARCLGWGSAALILILCALAPLVGATPAAAAKGDSGQPLSRSFSFSVKGSNGYEGSVGVFENRPSGKGGIILELTRLDSPRTGSSVMYIAPATVTRKWIKADLGSLGKISLRVVPLGRMKVVRYACEDEKEITRIRRARYEGMIEIHGEEGYSEVSATSARGRFVLGPRVICRGIQYGGAGKRNPLGGRLEVDREDEDDYQLEMNVSKDRPGDRTSISIWTDERRGRTSISRSVGLSAPPSTLKYSEDLSTATFRPPAPFSGVGTFVRDAPPAQQWTGDLTVDMPGRADVPLTGDGLSFALIRP